jgi:hypothetical protein
MEYKNGLSKDLEEQVQSLAGDIYIQVEETLSSMLAGCAESQLTNEVVEQHTHYLALRKSQQTLQTQLDEAKANLKQQIENTQLTETLAIREVSLKNSTEFNRAKVLLKENSVDISSLSSKLAAFIKQESIHIERIALAEEQLKQITQSKAKLENSAAILIKSDLAKGVALDLQSKQIEALHLKVDTANGDLEQLQLEQSQLLDAKALGEEKANRQVLQLTDKIKQLEKKIRALNDHLVTEIKAVEEKQQEIINVLNKEQSIIIATHQAKELADAKISKKQNLVAQKVKEKLEKLTKEYAFTKQKLLEQISRLQISEQESSAQYKDHLVAADKLSVSTNQQLQKQRDSLQQEANNKLDRVIQNNQEKMDEINENISVDEKRFFTDNQLLRDSLATIEAENESLKDLQDELKSKFNISELNLSNEKADAAQYQKDLFVLEEQLKATRNEQISSQQRIDSVKAKFERDSDQARKTIKNLRDANVDVTNNYEQRVDELEEKLTEYRLRFEYAQRQFAKKED